jgi:hypothetical protein
MDLKRKYTAEEIRENNLRGIYQRLLDAANHLKANVTELTPEEAATLQQKLRDEFAYGEQDVPLDFYLGKVTVFDEDAWRFSDEFLKDKKEVVLIYKEGYMLPMVRFANGSEVMPVLQCSGYGRPPSEFYLADAHVAYLMFFFHEGTLHTGGSASEWLKQKLNEVYEYIGAPPQPLLLNDIHTRSFGREIILDCLYDPQSPRPLQLVFRDCLDIMWCPFFPGKREPSIDFILLEPKGEADNRGTKRRRVTIRTTECVIKMNCEELTVEKDW